MVMYWSSARGLPALTERKIDWWNCCLYSTTSAAEKPAGGRRRQRRHIHCIRVWGRGRYQSAAGARTPAAAHDQSRCPAAPSADARERMAAQCACRTGSVPVAWHNGDYQHGKKKKKKRMKTKRRKKRKRRESEQRPTPPCAQRTGPPAPPPEPRDAQHAAQQVSADVPATAAIGWGGGKCLKRSVRVLELPPFEDESYSPVVKSISTRKLCNRSILRWQMQICKDPLGMRRINCKGMRWERPVRDG